MSNQNNHIEPPKWTQKLIGWFCDTELAEAIEGDLWEAFDADLGQYSARKSKRRYVINAVKFLKPQFMQKLSRTSDFAPQLGNYLKISLRNMQKHKLVASVNLLGFTLGLSVLLVVALYLQYQLSADKYVPDHERVYRVTRGFRSQVYSNLPFLKYYQSNEQEQMANIEAFRSMPQIEEVAQFTASYSQILGREFFVETNNRKLSEDKILFSNTPKALLNLFAWSVLTGDVSNPNAGTIVLSETSAKKYYGNDYFDAVGQTFRLNDRDYIISAVVSDIQENAHFNFDVLAFTDLIPNTWGAYTYLKLKEGVDPAAFLPLLNQAGDQVNPDRIDDPLEKGFFLQPITDIHLGSTHLYELETNANPSFLLLFGIIGGMVMLITIANYVNLSIALYSNRLKEIGVRKVIGARKKDIRRQFLFEAIFNALLSLPLAIVLVNALLPSFNSVMGLTLTFENLFQAQFLISLILVISLIGLISGLYPALLLSRKSLLSLIQNKFGSKGKGQSLRRFLVGSQFLLLVMLCGFGWYVQQQMDYMNNRDLGFEKEGVIYFDVGNVEVFRRLKDELRSIPEVKAFGHGSVPGNRMFNSVAFKYEGSEEIFDDAHQLYLDYGAAQALGFQSDALKELDNGRNSIYLVNETAAKRYEEVTSNSKNDIIGTRLVESPLDMQEDGTQGYPEVIDGIIADFNYFSLKENYNPLTIKIFKETDWVFSGIAKIETADMFNTISAIETIYNQQEVETPFKVAFLEDRLEALYEDDNRVANLVSILAVLAIVLAYFGLLGITYYTAKLRQKEMAIRKVFGASIQTILLVMSKDFLKVALIALVICVPLTIFWANQWLNAFAFRIDPNPVGLLVIGIAASVLMLSGVLIQSFKTASNNPIEPLRTES